ncbi:unnamed protein product [Alternaria alternata]
MSIPLRSVENVDSERFCRAMAFGGRLEETATPAEDATPANDYMMGRLHNAHNFGKKCQLRSYNRYHVSEIFDYKATQALKVLQFVDPDESI